MSVLSIFRSAFAGAGRAPEIDLPPLPLLTALGGREAFDRLPVVDLPYQLEYGALSEISGLESKPVAWPRPAGMPAPMMRGKDLSGRPYVALHVKSTLPGVSDFVEVLFQHHPDSPLWSPRSAHTTCWNRRPTLFVNTSTTRSRLERDPTQESLAGEVAQVVAGTHPYFHLATEGDRADPAREEAIAAVAKEVSLPAWLVGIWPDPRSVLEIPVFHFDSIPFREGYTGYPDFYKPEHLSAPIVRGTTQLRPAIAFKVRDRGGTRESVFVYFQRYSCDSSLWQSAGDTSLAGSVYGMNWGLIDESKMSEHAFPIALLLAGKHPAYELATAPAAEAGAGGAAAGIRV